jgi:hypothetical protein
MLGWTAAGWCGEGLASGWPSSREDGLHRAVGARADLQGAQAGPFQARRPERFGKPHDAQAGAEALFGMGAVLQDHLAEQIDRRPDGERLAQDALYGPVGVAAMAGRHVFRQGGVLSVTGAAHVDRDPGALEEDLDAARRGADFDAGAGMAIGHGVEVAVDIDVIVQADFAQAPLGQGIGLNRQSPEPRRVDLLEKLSASAADMAQGALIVERRQQLADGGVDFGQAVEPPMAQAAQEPALDDPHRRFDLGLSRGLRGLAGSTAVS